MADRRLSARTLIPGLLLVCTAAIYLPALGNAPLFLSHDEVVYSLQAHALATTGRDVSGRFLPMYIEYPPQFGRQTYDEPILIYAIAATLKALPFSESAIRLPMVVAGLVDVLLVYWIALTLFESELFAVAAAALVALTPAHFTHARSATDFQLSVPFVLGWLLCIALYLRRATPRLLFIAGVVLGVSLFGYIAAYVLVPILLLCTIAIVAWRREPVSRSLWIAAGLALPCMLALPWMLRNPLPFRDLVAHYAVLNGSESRSGIAELVKGFVESDRIRGLPALDASFFDPEFLFIDGPLRMRGVQLVGVFLIALSGAMAVGVVQAARRRSAGDVALLVGFLSGPLVASLGAEPQAVWRTLQMAPFGVLLAVIGLRTMWNADAPREARAAMVVTFAIPIALAVPYHDALPNAQALVRAATVPPLVAGFAVLLDGLAAERTDPRRVAAAGLIVLVLTYLAFGVMNHATTVGIVLLAAVGAATLLLRTPPPFAQPLAATALLAVMTATFMYAYVDYGQLQRVGPIPARIVVLAIRLAVASLVFAVAAAAIRLMARSRASGRTGLLLGCLVATEFAYYTIDYFSSPSLRALHAAVVLVSAVALAIAMRAKPARIAIGQIALAGVFGLAALQFTTFYADYFTRFSARGSAEVEGNVRGAFEAVITRAGTREIPAIYLGRIGPYAYGEMFWRFYLIKHHREDLQSRTIAGGTFDPDRVRALPAGSVVVTSPARDIDRAIDAMDAGGEFSSRELLRAPDGAPVFWILERR